MTRRRVCLSALAASVGGAVTVTELLHRRASRSARRGSPGRRSTAIVVLGYRQTKRGRVHPVQRWRVEIARRSAEPGSTGLIVFTGGSTKGGVSEAEAMAALAETLPPTGYAVAVEGRSTTTWENVRNALPLVQDHDCVMFASDPLHSARARRYAVRQRPDLADRIAGADDYRVLERWWLKAAAVAYEILMAVGEAHSRRGREGTPAGHPLARSVGVGPNRGPASAAVA